MSDDHGIESIETDVLVSNGEASIFLTPRIRCVRLHRMSHDLQTWLDEILVKLDLIM